MILLDIPQSAVTLATTVFSVTAVAGLAVAGFAFRYLIAHNGRLSVLETKIDPVWDSINRRQVIYLPTVPAPENPMKQERWDELALKLHKEQITEDEAREFLAALLKREAQAMREKDTATLVVVGAGIAFTEGQLKEKEREKKRRNKRGLRSFLPWPRGPRDGAAR